MWNRAGAPIDWPPTSAPLFRRATMFTSPIASTSNTDVASAYVASGAGLPVVNRTLRMPSACAPTRSDCMPIRLRSRQL